MSDRKLAAETLRKLKDNPDVSKLSPEERDNLVDLIKEWGSKQTWKVRG